MNEMNGKIVKKIKETASTEELVILEAGSFNGEDTKELSKFFPKSKIYAFEPIPQLYRDSAENTKNCPNVEMYELALGEKK